MAGDVGEDVKALWLRLNARRMALERQRTELAKWLAFFIRMFGWLAIGGALLAAVYGLCAGIGHPGAPAAGAGKGASAIVPADLAALRGTAQRFAAMLLALSIAGAAAAVGAATGFLFGLPRTLTSGEVRTAAAQVSAAATDQALDPAAPSAKLGTNTNLEQISDWLTKIIVGVGLTKLDQLPDLIEGFGDKVAPFFGVGGKVFGIGGGLYFLILGFFIGYVLTRTKLTWLFAGSAGEVDLIAGQYRDPAITKAVKTANSTALDARTTPLTSADAASPNRAGPEAPAEVREAGATLLSQPLGSFNTNDEIAARAAAEAGAGRMLDAASLYRQIVRDNPRSAHLVDYATVLALSGDKAKADDVVATIKTVTPEREAEARTRVLVGLLRSGLYNGAFEGSIDAGEQLVADPAQAADPWISVWLACAHGQKHKALKDGGGSEVDIKTERDRVVDLVKKAIAAAPAMTGFVRGLYDPASIKDDDDDLRSLWSDDELNTILGIPAT